MTGLWCLGLRDHSGALDFKEFRLAVRKEGKINKDHMSDAQLRSVSAVPSFSVLLPPSDSGSGSALFLLWQEAVPCDRPGCRRHDRRGRAACIPGAGGGAGRDAHHTQDRVAHKRADQAKEDCLVSSDTTTTQHNTCRPAAVLTPGSGLLTGRRSRSRWLQTWIRCARSCRRHRTARGGAVLASATRGFSRTSTATTPCAAQPKRSS